MLFFHLVRILHKSCVLWRYNVDVAFVYREKRGVLMSHGLVSTLEKQYWRLNIFIALE